MKDISLVGSKSAKKVGGIRLFHAAIVGFIVLVVALFGWMYIFTNADPPVPMNYYYNPDHRMSPDCDVFMEFFQKYTKLHQEIRTKTKGPTLILHLEGLSWGRQLYTLWNALLLAAIEGRALILAPLETRFDKYGSQDFNVFLESPAIDWRHDKNFDINTVPVVVENKPIVHRISEWRNLTHVIVKPNTCDVVEYILKSTKEFRNSLLRKLVLAPIRNSGFSPRMLSTFRSCSLHYLIRPAKNILGNFNKFNYHMYGNRGMIGMHARFTESNNKNQYEHSIQDLGDYLLPCMVENYKILLERSKHGSPLFDRNWGEPVFVLITDSNAAVEYSRKWFQDKKYSFAAIDHQVTARPNKGKLYFDDWSAEEFQHQLDFFILSTRIDFMIPRASSIWRFETQHKILKNCKGEAPISILQTTPNDPGCEISP